MYYATCETAASGRLHRASPRRRSMPFVRFAPDVLLTISTLLGRALDFMSGIKLLKFPYLHSSLGYNIIFYTRGVAYFLYF
jgi:hypothetical protein